MAKCALLSDHTILFYNRLPYSSCIVQSAVNSPLTQCFLKLCLIIPTVFVSTPFPYQDLGFSSRESTEKKASVLRPRVRVGDYIYLQYKAYCMRYKFEKKKKTRVTHFFIGVFFYDLIAGIIYSVRR